MDRLKANRLLASFPEPILSLLGPHLREVELRHGANIQKPGQDIETVYFPIDGVVSLVALTNAGYAVESGLVGREGAVNAFEAVNDLPAFGEATVQIAGSGLALSAAHMRTVALQSPPILEALSRAYSAVMVQARQSAACNATHVLEARLARWLLQTHDRVQRNMLPLTQEFMAIMLGVQRTSVTATLGNLSALGLIENRRGAIRIVDLDGLKAVSCDCYEIISNYADRVSPKMS